MVSGPIGISYFRGLHWIGEPLANLRWFTVLFMNIMS